MTERGKQPAAVILRAIQTGALRSARLFDKATGGCRMHEASESLLVSGIFEQLAKLRGATHLEVPVGLCRQEAKAIRCGKPSQADRMAGRYDLVHYWIDEKPRAAIEVKNGIKHLNRASFEGDFGRLANSLTASTDSSYQFCAFVYYATKDYPEKGDYMEAKKSAQTRLKALAGGVSDIAEEFVQHRGERRLIRRHYVSKISYSRHRDEGAWYVGTVVFADKRKVPSFSASLLD